MSHTRARQRIASGELTPGGAVRFDNGPDMIAAKVGKRLP